MHLIRFPWLAILGQLVLLVPFSDDRPDFELYDLKNDPAQVHQPGGEPGIRG